MTRFKEIGLLDCECGVMIGGRLCLEGSCLNGHVSAQCGVELGIIHFEVVADIWGGDNGVTIRDVEYFLGRTILVVFL